MLRAFTEHPASVGETYGQHFVFASRIGLRMVLGGAACMIHGLLPFLFQTTGSRTIRALHTDITRPRSARSSMHAPAHSLPEPEYLI